MNHLFIDNDNKFLEFVRLFSKSVRYSEVVVVTEFCASLADALTSIEKHRPVALFLGHDLDPAHVDAGLEVVRQVRDKVRMMYSTAGGLTDEARKAYAEMGVVVIGQDVSQILSRLVPPAPV